MPTIMPCPCARARLALPFRSTRGGRRVSEAVDSRHWQRQTHLFVNLGTSRGLVAVVAGSLRREGSGLVLRLLLVLLGLGSGGELMSMAEEAHESVLLFLLLNDVIIVRPTVRSTAPTPLGVVLKWSSHLVGDRALVGRVEGLVRVVLAFLVTLSTLRGLVSLSNVTSTGVGLVLTDGAHVCVECLEK